MTFKQIVDGYRTKQFTLRVNPRVIPDLMKSDLMDKNRKVAYKFYFYISILLFISVPFLMFVNWVYAFLALVFALVVFSANKKSGVSFVAERMVDSEEFYHFCLVNKFAAFSKDGHALLYEDGNVVDHGLFS